MRIRFVVFLILTGLAASAVPGSQAGSRARRLTTTKAVVHHRPDADQDLAAKEVHFYSEGVRCYGKIFTPKGSSGESKSPAVVVAPGWAKTADSVERYAARFAASGLVAMVLDYRGWGKSGGFLQTVDAVKTDDRLRFSQMTARIRIRRKRLIPEDQILDIRNALYYLQGEPGVDRSRVGVWGTDMAGGYAIVIAATDARIKAAVAQVPIIEGKDAAKNAWAPTGELLQAAQRLARTGPDTSTDNSAIRSSEAETRLARAQYHPFWYVEWVPQTTAVLFVTAEKDTLVNNETNAIAASKLVKGTSAVVSVPSATHGLIDQGAAFDVSASAAADWFSKLL
jgi:dienelactone hydrolase